MRLSTGLAISRSSFQGTPAQNSIEKKMPTNTMPVPRSGCLRMSSIGTVTTAIGFHRSSIDFGVPRRCASTRASISTTASLANSAGWPSRWPPMVIQPFTLSAVPPPDPKSSTTTSRKMAKPYSGTVIHSISRTDARLSANAVISAIANHTVCIRHACSTDLIL